MTVWEALFGVAFWATGFAVYSKVVKSGYGPARTQLETWAGSEGLKLISASPRIFWRGPFFFASGMQRVFRFSAVNGDGGMKHGWARCGWFFTSWKTGMAEQVIVKWDS